MKLYFTVPGIPVQQGSKRHVGNGRMIESAPNLQPWRDSVTYAAREAKMTDLVLFPASALCVDLEFTFPRPKSHYGTGRNAGALRGAAPVYKASKPDIDKLARAALDAITAAGVWQDDSQVALLNASKRYGAPGLSVWIEAT